MACVLAALVVVAFGCAPGRGGAPAGSLRSGADAWVSTLHREHPLVGRLWDVRAGTFLDEAHVEAALSRADLVLLGETHDNPDHHLLESRIVRALVAAGRRPAVAFEMLDTQQQAAVDAALAGASPSADAVAEAVGWARSGWPDFSLYRPVFAAAIDAGLPVVAANLARPRAREVASRGMSALSPRVREILERAGTPSDEAMRSLREEMKEVHCGELPESMLDPLVLMQRARDAQLAERVLGAADARGTVLVAGAGHVRTDRGVPMYLAREAPARRTLAVAFLEVSSGRDAPSDYADEFGSGPLPFDYVAFTPATEREDPCRGMHRRTREPDPLPPTSLTSAEQVPPRP